jgi:hypothetical protein
MNWVVPGLGSGSDYAATGGGASAVLGDGGSWVEIDVTEMAQTWVDNPAAELRLALAPGWPRVTSSMTSAASAAYRHALRRRRLS